MELSELELACGVSDTYVKANLANVYINANRDLIVVMMDLVPPAKAGALARIAYGYPVEYSGLNHLGHPVYRPIN